jgi:zinc transport system substrate-binding protein
MLKYLSIKAIIGCWAALFAMALHADAARISVFVSIPPQRYFVQQIGKDRVSVQVMVHPGASPATYEPKSVQMAAIAKTDVYFSIGVPFEDVWLKKIAATNPEMPIVATDRGIEKLPMATHHHDHGRDLEGHGHGHGSDKGQGHHLDPHIWTAPLLVTQQARNIATALKQIDPVHQKAYEANYATFAEALTQLDRELRLALEGFENRKFLVFHPSWGYFAQAYGLHQVPVEVEGKRPKPAHLHDIIAHARRDKIRVVFVQPQFSTKSARTIAAAIGAKVVVADPLAEDWADNLRRQTLKFKDALR